MNTADLVVIGGITLVNLLLVLLVARRVHRIEAQRSAMYKRPWLPAGTQVKGFESETVSGERVSLDRLRGQQILVGFFSTSCRPCREQLPLFASHAEADGGPQRVLAVVVGADEEAAEMATSLEGRALVIREGWRGPVTTAFSTHAFPSVYLLDPEGKVIASGPSITAITGKAPASATDHR